MRRNVWLVIVMVASLSVMLFTSSCTKNVVQTQPVTAAEPEVQQEPESPPEVEEQVAEPVNPVEDASRDAFVSENIHFALDSYALSNQAQQILNNMAQYLRTNPDITIIIEGHCDDRGTDEYNIALGERRAHSVQTFLGDIGIGTDRMNTVSYGEERPIAMGHDEASWAQNRRVQFVIN